MKKLLFNNNVYEAEVIIKTDNDIVGYSNNVVVFKFSGISDFSGFMLDDGQEFDEPAPSLEEKILQLKQEKDQLAETLDMVLTDLIPTLFLGGE